MIRRSRPRPLSLLPAFLLSFTLPGSVVPLRVSPNSPCTSHCIDSSDSNSTTTSSDDIVCYDGSFSSTPKGKKFQKCLTCLEDSDYVSGDENDQNWYLYNLRYAFDYCIFGYPNASDIESNPCTTTEACGPLKNALKKGITTPDDRKQYDYCEVDNEVMLTDSYSSCYSCVRAYETQDYISNFLTALEAGCEQQPSAGTPVSLNDTVFTEAAIEPSDPTYTSHSSSSKLTNAGIAGIVIGIIVLLLILVACVFMQHRRRINKARARVRSRMRAQPFAFYQQTRATESEFSDISRGDYYNDYAPVRQDQVASPCSSGSFSPVDDKIPKKLEILTRSVPWPLPVHPSPREATFGDVYNKLPTITTPMRSSRPSPLFSPGFGVASPRNSTPRVTRDARLSDWEAQLTGNSNKESRKKLSWGAVAPTGACNIQIKFDPPPRRAKK